MIWRRNDKSTREQQAEAARLDKEIRANLACLCVPACRRLGAGRSARRQEEIGYGG